MCCPIHVLCICHVCVALYCALYMLPYMCFIYAARLGGKGVLISRERTHPVCKTAGAVE